MAADITDLLRKYKSLFSTTLSGGIGTGTGDTITPSTVTGLPTDTAITLTFDRVDSSAVATPTKLERIRGIVSGGNFTSYVRAKDGTTEQAHSGGAVIEMVWNADDWNDMVDWGLQDHTQLGYHKTLTDTNGNEWIKQTATASAVNELTVANAATGNPVTLSATGGDTDVSLSIKPKGAGVIQVLDGNGNEVIKGGTTASAVNEITVTNAATGTAPAIAPTGGDTNIDLSLTGKGTGRVTVQGKKRITTITSHATPTINTDNCDAVTITAQAGAITSMTTNLSGTPTNFQPLIIRIKDNGTARAITWGASFASRGATLPTTTTISKVTMVGLFWNSVTSTWDCHAVTTEA